MASCKDCLYFERCVALGVELDMHHDKEADKNCRHFKNKADYAEVKHGKWIEDIKDISPANGIVPIKALVGYRCSVCNRPEFLKEPYCNCGAKMDEGS